MLKRLFIMAALRYYGAKKDSHDYRDHKKYYYSYEIPSRRHFDASVNLSKYVDHVYNQESLDSCTANALCAAYGLDLKKQESTLFGGFYYFDPSRLFLYYNTRERERNTWSDSGASIRDTIKALNCKGVCKESDWPYYTWKYTSKPPEKCYVAAKGNDLCKYERLDQDIDQLRACLKDNCPFVFGFNVYDSFDDYDTRNYGRMSTPRYNERYYYQLKGKHAVVAVGYDDDRKRVIVLNSWGREWGDDGYFYMPYDFIEDSEMCFDFWKITFACERDKPRPRNTNTGACGSGSGYGLGSYSSFSGYSKHF